jgi:hypothetical protein
MRSSPIRFAARQMRFGSSGDSANSCMAAEASSKLAECAAANTMRRYIRGV